MSRASRHYEEGDCAQRAAALVAYAGLPCPWETGPQRRRRIADLNRAERLAPSPRTRARMEADGLRFVGFYKASEGRRRRGGPMAWRPSWCEWWVGPYRLWVAPLRVP